MIAVHALEETHSIANLSAAETSEIEEFISEAEYLKELAEGEMTVQTIWKIKQTLHRLAGQSKNLRPEVTLTP